MNLFGRKKVKVIIYKKNRQTVIKKVKPESLSFEIDNQSYIIDKENYYIHKGIAIYSYLEQVPTPLSLKSLTIQKNKTETVGFEDVMMSAEELSIFKRSKSAKEVLNSIEKKMPENVISLFTLFATLIGLGILYFVLQAQITSILDRINQLIEILGVE